MLSNCPLCLKGSQEICVWPAEPDLDLWRAPPREHHSHQHRRVAGAGVGFSLHGTFTLISSLIWLGRPWLYFGSWLNSFLSCYSAVCRRLAPWPSPAHCVHLLCCWRSSRFQHYSNTHPEIVSHPIQNLCVFNLILWEPENSRKSSPAPWEWLLYRASHSKSFSVQFSSIFGSICSTSILWEVTVVLLLFYLFSF